MKNYYYLIWSDAIQRIRHHHPHDKDWKLWLSFYMSFMEAGFLCMTLIWLNKLNICYIKPICINLFEYDIINEFTSFIVTYTLPFWLLNYFLIFFRNRYEKIIKKYPMNEVEYAVKFVYIILGYIVLSLAAFSLVGNGRFIGD